MPLPLSLPSFKQRHVCDCGRSSTSYCVLSIGLAVTAKLWIRTFVHTVWRQSNISAKQLEHLIHGKRHINRGGHMLSQLRLTGLDRVLLLFHGMHATSLFPITSQDFVLLSACACSDELLCACLACFGHQQP